MIVICQLSVDAPYENFCFFLYILLGHIADGMLTDSIFHHDTIVTLLMWWYDNWFYLYRGTIVLDRYVIII